MVDLETARNIAARHVNAAYDVEGDELVILDGEIVEKDYGWFFFYTSRRYLETGEFRYMLAGNAPVVVEKEDGSLNELGTALPFEEYVEEYERLRRRRR